MPTDITGALADLDVSPRDPSGIPAAVPDFETVLEVAIVEFRERLREVVSPESAEDTVTAVLAAAALDDHWRRLVDDGFDAAYDDRVLKIGLAHRLRGIEPRTFLRLYGRFAARLLEETTRHSTLDRHRLADLVSILSRVIFLDLARVMHAYDVALLD